MKFLADCGRLALFFVTAFCFMTYLAFVNWQDNRKARNHYRALQ